MSAKITHRRRRAFLHALAASGNLSLSSERAKVSRSWVCLHRSTDPAFDAACLAAIASARVTLWHRQARGAAGKSKGSAYAHRRRWPRFAALWDEAVELGSEGIEAALIAGACAYMEGERGEIDGTIRCNSIGEAIKVLRRG